MQTLMGSLTLVEMECCDCITHFAMDRSLYDRCYESGRTFYCPNGHPQSFSETEIMRLKKLNNNMKKRMDWAEKRAADAREEAEHVKRQKAAIKGQLTKVNKRIANGVCPCCNRSFANVARHMDNKHPDFKMVVS